MSISAWLCFHPTSLHPSPSICGRIVLTRVMLRKYIMKLLVSQFNHCEVMRLDYISVFGLYFNALEKGLLV